MRSLVASLLEIDYPDRLGCGRGKTEDVKNHAFFQGTDWQQVYQLGLSPPIIPQRGTVNAANPADIGSFENQDYKQRVRTENYLQRFLRRGNRLVHDQRLAGQTAAGVC